MRRLQVAELMTAVITSLAGTPAQKKQAADTRRLQVAELIRGERNDISLTVFGGTAFQPDMVCGASLIGV